jgi:DNA-binding response OmpR family regulator
MPADVGRWHSFGIEPRPMLASNAAELRDPARRTLLVEDETAIRDLVALHLDLEGLDVTALADGRRALNLARSTPFDLILLDLMLPNVDGLTVCRAVRAEGPNVETPILLLTARDKETDKVIGLDSGADDYLTKPFGIRELMARVTALLRRRAREVNARHDEAVVEHAGVQVDAQRRQVRVRGEEVPLTKQEFDLLRLLIAKPGIVFSREALLTNVWGDDIYVTERTVDTLVSRLRKKIEVDPQTPELIVTAWGIGYRFAE